jgi:hypothetical protein
LGESTGKGNPVNGFPIKQYLQTERSRRSVYVEAELHKNTHSEVVYLLHSVLKSAITDEVHRCYHSTKACFDKQLNLLGNRQNKKKYDPYLKT